MIKAQQRLIIVIAAVLVALIVAYFAVVRPVVNKTEEVTTEPLVTVEGEIAGANGRYQLYEQVQRADMQSIEVVNEHGSYKFVRTEDGSFVIVYLADAAGSNHRLELTWLRDWDRPYNLGDNEIHLAFTVDDFAAAHALHEKMGCICFENEKMGIYFITDPDGYWLEVLPVR